MNAKVRGLQIPRCQGVPFFRPVNTDFWQLSSMKILVFAPHSLLWKHAFPEALVCEALKQKGHEIVYMTCGGIFSDYCISMLSSKVPWNAPAAEKAGICARCKRNAQVLREEFRFHGSDLADGFTEQGVAMLSSILNSKTAIEVNITIIRVFTKLREYALTNKDLTGKLRELETKYDKQFNDVYEALNFLFQREKQQTEQATRKRIGFKRQNDEDQN